VEQLLEPFKSEDCDESNQILKGLSLAQRFAYHSGSTALEFEYTLDRIELGSFVGQWEAS
jgi:hypothetical protein